jgi:putative peptide zinc metalloprotease protein
MKPIRKLTLAILLAALLSGGWGAATASAQDTAAVAVNTKDGSDLIKVAFQIRHTMQDVVDNTNAAVAYASCSDCQTVAISFQVVLAGGDASTVTPTNLALALNENCTACETAAFAYQFVTSGDVILHFTAEGNRRIAALRRRLQALRNGDLTLDQINAEVGDIANELRDVLANELVSVGPPSDGASPGGQAQPGAGASPSASETPSPEPAQSPSGSATPEPTATTSPTATPTVTATVTPTSTPTPDASASATP